MCKDSRAESHIGDVHNTQEIHHNGHWISFQFPNSLCTKISSYLFIEYPSLWYKDNLCCPINSFGFKIYNGQNINKNLLPAPVGLLSTMSNVESGPPCLLESNPHGPALPTCTDNCQSQEDRTVLALKLFKYFKELENEIFF